MNWQSVLYIAQIYQTRALHFRKLFKKTWMMHDTIESTSIQWDLWATYTNLFQIITNPFYVTLPSSNSGSCIRERWRSTSVHWGSHRQRNWCRQNGDENQSPPLRWSMVGVVMKIIVGRRVYRKSISANMRRRNTSGRQMPQEGRFGPHVVYRLYSATLPIIQRRFYRHF